MAIYSSPLQRTMQTAAIIGRTMGLTPIPEQGFIEMRLGPWEGMSEEAVAAQYPEEWRRWNSRPDTLHLPGRETLAQLRDRLMAAVKGIKAAAPGGAVLVVTHVAVIRVLTLQATGRELSEYKSIEVPNCGVFPIERL
jgi:broad specificity phosphatase PhoE